MNFKNKNMSNFLGSVTSVCECHFVRWKLLLIMKSKASAWSVDSRFLFSSYTSPATENKHSDGTEVGGALKYLCASTAKCTLLVDHQFNTWWPLWNLINGSDRYKSTSFPQSSTEAPGSSRISERHWSNPVLCLRLLICIRGWSLMTFDFHYFIL